MDCAVIAQELVPYHLGAIDDDVRDAIDEHLCGCTACLRSYLRVKRAVERENGELRPSDRARERLRGAVFERFRPSALTRARRALAKPVPLYQTLALAACVAIFLGALPRIVPSATSVVPRASGPAERVDTARPVPLSLGID